MKICILGSWQAHKAVEFKKEAEEIGKLLAERGHTLVSGGGTGMSKLVVDSYRKHNGKRFIAYFPSEKVRKKVGKEKGPKPDKAIETNVDYPERNIIMMRESDVLIGLHGGLGTIAEMIHAVKDYHKKVSVIDKGEMAGWIKAITPLREKVFITKDIKEAIDYLEK
jgi:hypothetical protein